MKNGRCRMHGGKSTGAPPDKMKGKDEKPGVSKTVIVPSEQLVTTPIEEIEFRVIEDILRVEDAPTRVQDKKTEGYRA